MDTTSPLAPIDPAQRYTLNEAVRYLRMGRKRLFQDIKAGRIKGFKEGKRRYFHGSELIARSAPPA